MSNTARQQQKGRKNEPQGQAGRRPPNAWGQPNRNSGAYSPAPNNRPLANASPAPASSNINNASTAPAANAVGSNGTFPPLNGSSAPTSTPASRSDAERTLQSLAGLTGTTVTVSLRNGPRFEGVVDSTAQAGDTPGLTLRDARDVNIAGSPIKDRQFIAAANIASWLSGPAGTKPTTAPNGDSFKTDVDISFKAAPRRERELQAWADDSVGLDLSPGGANHSPGATIGHGDDTTFGTGASRNTGWDQFATNEKLFGVKAGFDEEAYTTKLNRDAPDFKERERKAQQLANEIMNSGSHNPHIAEERVMNLTGDNGINEEDKHAAVVRSPGAYVPPAARKGSGGAVGVVNLPKVSVNAPDGTPAPLLSANANATRTSGPPSTAATPAAAPTSTSTPGASTPAAAKSAGAATPEGAFRDFVSHEKKRLAEKKQTMMRKDMEARFADLMSFSKSFKLKQPLPEDLVPILAKDEDKQAAIRDKALADASAARSPGAGGASAAGPIAASLSSTNNNPVRLDAAHAKAGGVPSAVSAKAAVPAKTVDKKKPAMFIQAIPAFKGKKASTDSTPAGSAGGSAVVSPQLNQNAPSFRPNPKAVAFSPTPGQPAPVGKQAVSGPSPKPARAVADTSGSAGAAAGGTAATHPFFGRPLKKPAGPVSIRDDFNPFKHNKVAEPSAVGNNWPYSGKRFMHHYPVGPSNPGSGGAGGPGGGPGVGGGPGGPGGPGMQNGLGMIPGVGPNNALNISMQPPGGHVPHIQVPPGATPNMQGVPLPGVGPPGGPNNITASPNMHVAQHIMQQPGGPQGPGGGPGFDEDPAQAAARAAQQAAQAQAQAGQYMFYPPHYYPGQPMMPGMPPPPQPGYMPGPYMQMYPPMGPNGQPMYAASPQMGQMPLAPPYGMPPPGAYPPPNGRGPSMPPTPMPHNAHAHTYYQPSPQMQHAVPYPMMMPPPGQQMGGPPGGPGAPPPPGQGPPSQGHYEQPGQQGGPQQMGVPHA